MAKKNKLKLGSSIVFLTSVLTFFLLGVFYADKIKDLYVKNVLKTDITEVSYNSEIDFFNRKDLDLDKFWETYDTLKKNYYSLEGIKKEDLINGAISGMIDAVGDDHSEYFNKDQTDRFNEGLSGNFEGIGAFVEKTDLGVKIQRLIKGSPAIEYGLLKDDILTEANGEDLVELDLFDAVEKIKGPAGTKVALKVLRSGEAQSLMIDVVRARIQIPSVESKSLTGSYENLGYIALNMYGDNTAEEFSEELAKFKNDNYDGILIDLRDNGGGYLQSAVEILSEFIDNGELLVTTRYKNSFMDTEYKSAQFGETYNGKIVVLINGNSASASEITAGTLREYDKAIILGEKSYGKGSVQQPFDLSDGSMVKLTIAKWFTPEGLNIDEEGITPDIEVRFKKEDYEQNYDRQLDRAKEVLKMFVETNSITESVENYKNIYKTELEDVEVSN